MAPSNTQMIVTITQMISCIRSLNHRNFPRTHLLNFTTRFWIPGSDFTTYFTTFYHFLPLFYHFFTTHWVLFTTCLCEPVRGSGPGPSPWWILRCTGIAFGQILGVVKFTTFYHFFTTFLPLFYHSAASRILPLFYHLRSEMYNWALWWNYTRHPTWIA